MKKALTIIIIIAIFILLFINKNNLLKLFYPIKYSEYVEQYSKEYSVDKYLIYATIKAESNFDEKAISSKKAMGLMQLMLGTAKDIAKTLNTSVNSEKILDPQINIQFGTKYISQLIQKYNDIGLSLAAYNAGSSNVDAWINNGTLKSDGSNIENIPFKETNNYVRKILKNYEIYRTIYK